MGPGEELAAAAREMFNSCQMNDDEMIDVGELQRLLIRLSAVTKRHFSGIEEKELLDASMERFGELVGRDETLLISFPDFVRLVASKPWNALLPEEVQDHFLLTGQALSSERVRLTAVEEPLVELEDLHYAKVYVPPEQLTAGGRRPGGDIVPHEEFDYHNFPAGPPGSRWIGHERAPAVSPPKENNVMRELHSTGLRMSAKQDGSGRLGALPAVPASVYYSGVPDITTAVHDLGMAPEDWHEMYRSALKEDARSNATARQPLFGNEQDDMSWDWRNRALPPPRGVIPRGAISAPNPISFEPSRKMIGTMR